MKNRFLIIIISIAALSSCDKFLDLSPTEVLEPKNYYNTTQELNRTLNGVYDILGGIYSYVIPIGLNIGTDEAFFPASGGIGLNINQFEASDASISGLWNSLYSGIYRANILLENIDKSQADTISKKVIRGEALFLRAYYHFQLVSMFGDIPMKLESSKSVLDVSQPRTPSNLVYGQIVKDMEEAERLVRTATEVKTGGHISKSAVRGILARVYLYWSGYPLYANKYDKVLYWAKQVNVDNEHELNPSFRQVFINYARDKYDIKESIWEVEFYSPGITTYSEGSRLGNINGVQCVSLDSGYCYGQMNGTAKLFNSYGGKIEYSKDNRRDWVMANYKLTGDASALRIPVTSTTIYDRNAAKWRREYEPYSNKDKNNTNENFPLLRYSDVLLMIAEADNELNGPTTVGINAINAVRERAYKSVKSFVVTSGGSGYTSMPKVVITGGGGEGATATALISGGKVTYIYLTYAGYGYTSTPQVNLIGANGLGAIVTVVLTPMIDADLTTVQTANKTVFRQAIQDERMRELCFEGHRRLDLIRWGNYIKQMKDYAFDVKNIYSLAAIAPQNLTDRNVLLPIPASELSVNKMAIQNPGY